MSFHSEIDGRLENTFYTSKDIKIQDNVTEWNLCYDLSVFYEVTFFKNNKVEDIGKIYSNFDGWIREY